MTMRFKQMSLKQRPREIFDPELFTGSRLPGYDEPSAALLIRRKRASLAQWT